MTDGEAIFDYRMRQTEETLSEAVRMLEVVSAAQEFVTAIKALTEHVSNKI